MITLAFPRFRAGYAIAACSVALAATCAYQMSEAPGLMQAILVVGANAQLPLERLATEADRAAPVSSATAISSDWKARPSAEARPTAQRVEQYGRPVHERRVHRDVHGYERTVTDYKYWT
jgi:hypothetical protein